MTMHNKVKVELAGNVAIVTIDNPPYNYVGPELLSELADRLEALDEDSACRAVILCSNGKIFCAGADLSGGVEPEEEVPEPGQTSPLYDQAVRLHATRKPIVVSVQGPAVGAGLGMALLGDFRIAAPEARFAANFVKLGFHPGFGLTVTLPRLIGSQAAAMMLLTGRRIDAQTAHGWGLVDQIAPPDQIHEKALALASEIAANAPLAVQATRATLRKDLADIVRAQTDVEWRLQLKLVRTVDFAEGVRAVSERRPGNFQGR